MNLTGPAGFLPDGRQSEAALRICRGVRRHLASHGFASLPEVSLRSGRRADIVAINGRGDIWIVEIKSSIADFRTDTKWPEYQMHCDRFFFATSPDVPLTIFPQEAGLIVADGFGAETLRMPEVRTLAGATRKEVLVRFARAGAFRLQGLDDPGHGDPSFRET